MKRFLTAALLTSFAATAPATAKQSILNKIKLPPGFSISVFAKVQGARAMATGPDGVVYVSSKNESLYALTDEDGDGTAEKVERIGTNLPVLNGLAIAEGELFLGMADRVAAWTLPEPGARQTKLGKLRTVIKGLNPNPHHGRRYLGIGPKGRLYVALGAPCNICDLKSNTGKIISVDRDGSDARLVADGVRNSVGFDWNPTTKQLWFTDNGADRMGDELPADELNRVRRNGEHYGFPWRGGKDTPLTGSENVTPPVKVVGAEMEMQAHSANLGIDFYEGGMFPAKYRGDAFIAQRGSWNRSTPIGYRVMRVRFDAKGNAIGKEVFAEGWLQGTRKLGRISDVEERPDGSLLVSDDKAGLIYRIAYGG